MNLHDKITQNLHDNFQKFQNFNENQNFDLICFQEHKLIKNKLIQQFQERKCDFNEKYKTFAMEAARTGNFVNFGCGISVNGDLIDKRFKIQFFEPKIQFSGSFVKNYLQCGRVQFLLLQCDSVQLQDDQQDNRQDNVQNNQQDERQSREQQKNEKGNDGDKNKQKQQNILVINIYQQAEGMRTNLMQQFDDQEQDEIYKQFQTFILDIYRQCEQDIIINKINDMIKQFKMDKTLYDNRFQQIVNNFINNIMNEQTSKELFINSFDKCVQIYSKYLTDYIVDTVKIFMLSGNQIKTLDQIINEKKKDINYSDILFERLNSKRQSVFRIHTDFLSSEQRTELKKQLFQNIANQIQQQIKGKQLDYNLQKSIVENIVNQKGYFEQTINNYVLNLYNQNIKNNKQDKIINEYFRQFYYILFRFILEEIIRKQQQIQKNNFYKELFNIVDNIKQHYNVTTIICGDLNAQYQNFDKDLKILKDKGFLDIQQILQQQNKQMKVDFDEINFKGFETEQIAKQRRQNIRLDYILLNQTENQQINVQINDYHLYDSYTEEIRTDGKRDHDPLVANITLCFNQQQQQQQITEKQQLNNEQKIIQNTPFQSVYIQDNDNI